MPTYAGWQMDCQIGTTLAAVTGSGFSNSVAGIQRITYDYDSNTATHEVTGQRTLYAITEGVIVITGTLERIYTGSATLNYTRGTNETGSLTTYYLGIYPSGYSSGQSYIALDTVKFGKRTIAQRPGANVMTEVQEFTAMREYTGSLS